MEYLIDVENLRGNRRLYLSLTETEAMCFILDVYTGVGRVL